MMNKSYFVFTSYIYRIVMFIGLPLLMFGLQMIFLCRGQKMETKLAVLWLMITQNFLIVIEVLSDMFLFGGIQSKDAEKMDYLKTSPRGMQVMKNALTMDLIRRFCTALGIISVEAVVFRIAGVSVVQGNILLQISFVLFIVLVTYLFSVLGVVISRSFGLLWLNAGLGYVMSVLAVLCGSLPEIKSYAVVYDVALAVFCIGLSILTVRTAMKKVEGSYYDK